MLTLCLAVLAASGCRSDSADTSEPVLLNFHPLVEGQVYRGPQLSGEALSWVIDRYKLKTVFNLRGAHPEELWYREESSACKAKGVQLVDLAMSSQSMPEPALLKSIVATLKRAPTPLLIHCESGADRSGAVAALYRMEVLKQDRTAALKELSPDYWHFRAKKPCMDTLVEMYESTPEWMAQYEQNYQNIVCK